MKRHRLPGSPVTLALLVAFATHCSSAAGGMGSGERDLSGPGRSELPSAVPASTGGSVPTTDIVEVAGYDFWSSCSVRLEANLPTELVCSDRDSLGVVFAGRGGASCGE